MEDMARLALVEQAVRDTEYFNKILYEILRHIDHILENPHDYEVRTIKSEVLKKVLQHEVFVDYLKSIGFQSVGNEYTYPKENTLSNLRMAQATVERKIYFCCGSLRQNRVKTKSSHSLAMARKPKLIAANVLNTNNALLLKIERLFNDMIKYENEELQDLAREHIPIVTLQLMALDRIREHQRKLKSGEIKGHDMSFDIALLMELLGWFKFKFFSWMDRPPCETCGGATALLRNTALRTETEICNVELYKCTQCKDGRAQFIRHNDVRTLLRTRRGRCGEWANCFTLLCRALGYDTRYVYDTTDHVWCEVFDFDSNTWLHVDPCEAKLNAPLLYACGWNKRPCYVIAVSRDDLQDVTWRYTVDHSKVLERRTECEETELISALMTLRDYRQKQLSEARRRYLNKRCLQELVELLVERKPSDYECHGRISGSKEWRSVRGEITSERGYVFHFERPGRYCVQYYTATDLYRVSCDEEGEQSVVQSWHAGAYDSKNVFRKLEPDWMMVYLAREEGETFGSISWKVRAGSGLTFTALSVRLSTAVFETGAIEWTVLFDDTDSVAAEFGETTTEFVRRFATACITAELTGGLGTTAWQHAQLCRQRADATVAAMELHACVAADELPPTASSRLTTEGPLPKL